MLGTAGALVGLLLVPMAEATVDATLTSQLHDEAKALLDSLLADHARLNDPTEPAGGSRDGASAMAGAPSASTVLGRPIQFLSTGLLALGLQILAGLFAGFEGGVATFATATRVVADNPAQSAGIAAVTIAVLGLLSSLAWAAQRYGSLGAIPLFSRIAKSQLLDHPVRSQIYELIRANPGVNVSEISRLLDLAWGTTTHHLQKLRQDRLVAIRVVSNQKCYFPNAGAFTPHEMDVLSATKNPTARRMAELVVKEGPHTHGEITRALGVSPALVSFYAERLVGAGVLARHRDGRRTIFTALESNLQPQPRPAAHV